MKAKEYRDRAVEELEANLEDNYRELFALVNELKLTKKLDKPSLIRQKRKDIARIKTVLREKQG